MSDSAISTEEADLSVGEHGDGPPVVLIRGMADATTTWRAQVELAARWRLVIPSFAEPTPDGTANKRDFEREAGALERLRLMPAHVVAHSYGALGALIAAGRSPGIFRSLTVIEPPLLTVAQDVPPVRELGQTVADFIAGRQTSRVRLRALLDAFGHADEKQRDAPFGLQLRHVVNLVRNARPASDANPDLGAIADGGLPTLVVSGAHDVAAEVICTRLADHLGGRRLVVPGSGHFAPFAPTFNSNLERFLVVAERSHATACAG